MDAHATILRTETLAKTRFSTLSRSLVAYRRRDGTSQEFWREAYDHGDGAAVLLHDPVRDCVLLVRQWRFGAYSNPAGRDGGWLLEVPAGLVDGRDPAAAIAAEVAEETGLRLGPVTRVLDCYMSPGSLTERVSLFEAAYSPADTVGPGGGLAAEGEDIEVLEIGFDAALAAVASGDITDAKTVILLYHRHAARLAGAAPAAR